METKENKEHVFEPQSIQFFRRLLEESKKDNNLKTFKLAEEDIMPNSIQKRRVVFCKDELWKQLENRAVSYKVSISSALRYVVQKGLSI
ncbi:MAG: hypothetical protein Q8R00_03150 [Candidatus Nanoarchaeia archaeon]|nr:hypothetical protein [Candidatus Nanoarchaeia archaeon]